MNLGGGGRQIIAKQFNVFVSSIFIKCSCCDNQIRLSFTFHRLCNGSDKCFCDITSIKKRKHKLILTKRAFVSHFVRQIMEIIPKNTFHRIQFHVKRIMDFMAWHSAQNHRNYLAYRIVCKL